MSEYVIAVSISLGVMAGAVVYESRRQKANWRRYQDSLKRLRGSYRTPFVAPSSPDKADVDLEVLTN